MMRFSVLLQEANVICGIYLKEGLKHLASLVYHGEKDNVSKARKILDRILSGSKSTSPTTNDSA